MCQHTDHVYIFSFWKSMILIHIKRDYFFTKNFDHSVHKSQRIHWFIPPIHFLNFFVKFQKWWNQRATVNDLFNNHKHKGDHKGLQKEFLFKIPKIDPIFDGFSMGAENALTKRFTNSNNQMCSDVSTTMSIFIFLPNFKSFCVFYVC